MKQEHDDTLKRFEKAVEASKVRLRKFLMDKSAEERFKIMREDFAMNSLETLCEWALPEEDYEICATVEKIRANNTADFKVRFEYEGENNNKAHVVRFESGGMIYYHADYILHDEEEGSLVMLHRQEDGTWHSEWNSSDPRFFAPIGAAIDRWETTGSTEQDSVVVRLDG